MPRYMKVTPGEAHLKLRNGCLIVVEGSPVATLRPLLPKATHPTDSGFDWMADAVAAAADASSQAAQAPTTDIAKSPNAAFLHKANPRLLSARYAAFPEHVQSLAQGLAVWSALIHMSRARRQAGFGPVKLPLNQDENIYRLCMSIVQFVRQNPHQLGYATDDGPALELCELGVMFDVYFGSSESLAVDALVHIVKHFTKGGTYCVGKWMISACLIHTDGENHYAVDEAMWHTPLVVASFGARPT